jgi:hypothetical protein
MGTFRQYRFFFLFLALLLFCSLMVMRQFNVNRSKHIELREAFILLHSKGYTNQAIRLFTRLLTDLPEESNKTLVDDFQRTLMLVDPGTDHPENLIWKYHWTVSNELERRSASTLRRALKLADKY